MASFAKEVLELIGPLTDLRLSSYVDIGSFSLLVYDYLLTFEDERNLMWPARWSILKVSFLFIRYLPFVDLSITASQHFRNDMTPEACMLAYQSAGWLMNIGVAVSEFILVIRTWAILERTRFSTIVLVVWSSIGIIADFVIMGLFMRSIGFSSLPTGLSGCLITRGNSLITGLWILLMGFEVGILLLMVIKGIQMYRELGGSALYLALFRCGGLFYVYIFTLSVADVVVISRVSRELYSMLASLERVTHAILTQRLVLTLRRTVNEPRDYESINLDAIQFDERPRAFRTIDTEPGDRSVLTSPRLN